MVTALEKAQGALERAKALLDEHGADMPPAIDRHYVELLGIAQTQANIAQAVALDRLANITERQAVAFEGIAEFIGGKFG